MSHYVLFYRHSIYSLCLAEVREYAIIDEVTGAKRTSVSDTLWGAL